MSDCSEEDIFQYQSLKKRKTGEDDPTYELPSSSMSSQKRKKKRKKKLDQKKESLQIENVGDIVKAESTQGPDSMEFCPMCQMPLSIAIGSPDLHVAKCVGEFEKSSFEGECPFGLDCDVTIRQHYQRYSHHVLSEFRAGLNAEKTANMFRESRKRPERTDSHQAAVPIIIHSSSPVNVEKSLTTKEETKLETKFQDSDSEIFDSPSVSDDVHNQDCKTDMIISDNIDLQVSEDNLVSSDTDLSVELSPNERRARKTFPYSPRQFQPEKVVCLLDISSDANSSDASLPNKQGFSSNPRKISNTGGNLDVETQEIGNESSRTVSARMSCANSSPLDSNSTVSFSQKLSAHRTSTPKSLKPRNVARKSVKGKKYLSIEEVQNSQRAAAKEYICREQSSQDIGQVKNRKELNSIERGNDDSRVQTEKMSDSDELNDEKIGQGRKGDRNIESLEAKSIPQRTSSPSLYEFGCEGFDDDCDENELLNIISQEEEAYDAASDKRESSSQGNSQCNKITVQSQIDNYFVSQNLSSQESLSSSRKLSSQETLASQQNAVNTGSQSTAGNGENKRPKSTWKDIFRSSQGTKFSSRDKVSQSQSSTTASQSYPATSVDSGTNHGQSGVKKGKGGGSMWSQNQKRQCPFYKKMPGTSFAVDAFSYGDIPDITAYFLTHFHSDHYGGLTKKFTNPIYCSVITANLVKAKLYVPSEYVFPLAMEEEHTIEGVKVTFLDANHCPGSVLILFKLSNGLIYLHTGDFRAHQRMELYPQLHNLTIHKLYLDTTYCDPKYDFPKQDNVVQFAVNITLKAVQENPKTLILCGTYTIGKEKVFKAISDALGCKICVESDKKRILSCYNDDQLVKKLVTDKKATRLHVVGMAKLNLKRLALYLEEFHNLYDNIVAFKPTGWTHSSKANSLADIKPSKWGRIQIYGIPYSEHSSYSELKRFVQFIRASGPTKIIPTVNVGRPDQRDFMESHFKMWMSQGNASPGMNGLSSSQTRPQSASSRRNMQSSPQSKILETFFKKK